MPHHCTRNTRPLAPVEVVHFLTVKMVGIYDRLPAQRRLAFKAVPKFVFPRPLGGEGRVRGLGNSQLPIPYRPEPFSGSIPCRRRAASCHHANILASSILFGGRYDYQAEGRRL